MAIGSDLAKIAFSNADKGGSFSRRKCPHRLLRLRRKEFCLVLLELVRQLQRVCCQKRRKMLLVVLEYETRLHGGFPN
jgi:hypothetical protein